MAWTTEEKTMFKKLFDQVQGLVTAIAKCCNGSACKCECMQQPWRIVVDSDIWHTETNNEGETYYVQKSDEELSINDRFPETICDGQKGDLLFNDGILLCHYVIGSNGNPTGWVSDKAYFIPQP